ncbi:MAG: class IV adenylate cyclase [Dehalococcoidales bacterium]|nr:class IV adenylate cyclase [Dehalococcoidales bacterium]
MPANVEIKARITDREATSKLVERISVSKPERIYQEDTFFFSQKGRLKLRVFADVSGELIYYKRPDTFEPGLCEYQRTELSDPEFVRKCFSETLGIRGSIRKQRTLYNTGSTRIHLDKVDNLGDFLELEVVLGPDDTQEKGKEIIEKLMSQLEIDPQDLVSCAYIDLLCPCDSEGNSNTALNRTEFA